LGVDIKVMVAADMFAHKLCSLLDRNAMTNRDIFDSWFFMKNRTPVNRSIIETRMKMPYTDYIQKCINSLEAMKNRKLLQGLGELMDDKMKNFVRTGLLKETIVLLNFYKSFPITEDQNQE